MILMKGHDPVGQVNVAVIDLLLLVQDGLNLPLGFFQTLQVPQDVKAPPDRFIVHLASQSLGAVGPKIGELLEIAPYELQHLFVNLFSSLDLWLGQLRKHRVDLLGHSGVRPIGHVNAKGFGFLDQDENLPTAALQKFDIGGITDVQRDASRIDDEFIAALERFLPGGGVENLFNEGHPFRSDLGPEIGQARGRVHVINRLLRRQAAEALGVKIFLHEGDGVPIRKVLDVFEDQRSGLRAQRNRMASFLRRVKDGQSFQQMVPLNGRLQLHEGMLGIVGKLQERNRVKRKLLVFQDKHRVTSVEESLSNKEDTVSKCMRFREKGPKACSSDPKRPRGKTKRRRREPPASVQKLNIAGALTVANNAVINTTLASASVYGHIVPAGGPATVGTGVNVNVSVPAGAYISAGTKFDIIQPQNGGTTGAGLSVTDSSNPLYIFSTQATAPGQVEITLVTTPVTSVPTSPDAPPLPALPALIDTPLTTDIAIVLGGINAQTDQASLIHAASQLGPTAAALEAPFVTMQAARDFQNLWLSRLDICGPSAQPNQDQTNCQGTAGHGGWWLNGFGNSARQHDRDNLEGYRSSAAGTMLAYDVLVGEGTRVGMGLGYARSSIVGNTYDGRTDIDSYQATAYAGHDQGAWFVHGSGSIGMNEYSGSRPIIFTNVNRTADADYSGQNYTALANTGYHAALPQKFTLTPLASLQYTRVNIHSYTETGAGDINLRVASQGYDFLQSGLGTKVERDFSYHNVALVPDIHVEWMHDLMNPTLAQSANFTAPGAPSFVTQGLSIDRNTYRVGTALTLLSCKCTTAKLSVEGGYDFYWTHGGYTKHQLTLQLTDRF